MNHDIIASALCGRYVPLAPNSGYIESNMVFPQDGALIGAYLVDAGDGRVRITDDGDVAFNVASAGVDLTKTRTAGYRALAARFGLDLDTEGVLGTTCAQEEVPFALARYLQAAGAIATASLKHRPKDDERFERIVGALLRAQFGKRVTVRPGIVGISGHPLRFPFGLDLNGTQPILIQTIPADDDRIKWSAVYETGGKFQDVQAAQPNTRLVAVLEAANDSDRASRFFANTADVIVYESGPLLLAA